MSFGGTGSTGGTGVKIHLPPELLALSREQDNFEEGEHLHLEKGASSKHKQVRQAKKKHKERERVERERVERERKQEERKREETS